MSSTLHPPLLSGAKLLIFSPPPRLFFCPRLCSFTMASRNALTNKAQHVPALLLETPEERLLSEIAQAHKAHKKHVAKTSLNHTPPAQDEAALLHEQFLQDRAALQRSMATTLLGGSLGSVAASSMVAPSEGMVPATNAGDKHAVVTTSSTSMSTCIHMHPQQTNGPCSRPLCFFWRLPSFVLTILSCFLLLASFAGGPQRTGKFSAENC